ncbi:diacylglycerol/lipid kinase family protein [Arthrobacter sp. A5]|uniref:diacylglycerol/lipid kinase family protein n=1 Tax=Arthrobacter sp. A5 TaxID=576926 RepID=UPI003DA9EABB
MPTWVLVLIIVSASLAFLIASWWGVRKLAQKHTRSAAGEIPHKGQTGNQKVAVILNPVKAGAPDARTFILRSAALAGWKEPLFFETTMEDPGYSQARQALEYGADVVVVGGGDGTVRVVAEVLRHTQVPMGVIPLGTGNLLARNLGLRVNDIHSDVQTALFGHQRHIDTATMAIENSVTGASSKHAFLVIAGLGMDAEVVGDTRKRLKRTVGWLAYSEAGMRHLPGRRKKISIAMDDQDPQQRKVRTVLFANCGLLPGGIDFVPNALIDDGVLDVVVASPRSALGWAAMAVKIVLQHKGRLPVIDYYRAEKITIRTAVPEETQLDGDTFGKATKVTVAVEPKALLVRVKAQTI